MPKFKSRKSILKRFRVTKKGKVLRKQAFRRHLKVGKTKKRLTNLKKTIKVNPIYAKKIKRYLGKGK